MIVKKSMAIIPMIDMTVQSRLAVFGFIILNYQKLSF